MRPPNATTRARRSWIGNSRRPRNRDAAGDLAHRGRIVHPQLLHEEGDPVARLVAHEAVEHPLLRDHGEVAVGAAVERAGTAVVGAGALELDMLPDDPHEVRRVADLLDDVVGDQAHAVNSAIVTPWPPRSRGAKPKRSTRGSRARRSCTNWRSAPVPLPWMIRRYGRSARIASSRALISTASASSTLSPRSETSVVAVVLVGDRSPPRGGRPR